MAKNSKKRLNANEKAFYLRYKNEDRNSKNRLKALEKHIKRFPEDSQAVEALNSNYFPYRRNIKGHTKKVKDSRDKFRFGKYIWDKAYPKPKKLPLCKKGLRAGFTIREQLTQSC